MKRTAWIIISSIIIAFCIYRLIFVLSPAIEIFNDSDKTLVEGIFYLPESRIVMDNVLPNEKSKTYYDLKQRNGELRYVLTFSDSSTLKGNCGIITNYDFGKRIQIEINKENKIVCKK